MRFRRRQKAARVPKWKATIDLTGESQFTATITLLTPTSYTISSSEFGARSFPTWKEEVVETAKFRYEVSAHNWVDAWGENFSRWCSLVALHHYELIV